MPESMHKTDAFFTVEENADGIEYTAEDKQDHPGQRHPLDKRNDGGDDAPSLAI